MVVRSIYRERRPWGEFHQYTRDEVFTVKTLIVRPGESLSDRRYRQRTDLEVSEWHRQREEGYYAIDDGSHADPDELTIKFLLEMPDPFA